MTAKHTIKIDSSRGQPRVLRGASYLFRSPLAARSMSRSCTTNPGVQIFIAADGVEHSLEETARLIGISFQEVDRREKRAIERVQTCGSRELLRELALCLA